VHIVGLRIKDPLTSSISPEFYSRTGRGGSSNLVFMFLFSAVLIPPSLARSSYGGALLSTHMARAHGRGSYVVGGILD
jgi:hypothetical protein